MGFPTELTEELHATLLPFLSEQQMEEILAKVSNHQKDRINSRNNVISNNSVWCL